MQKQLLSAISLAALATGFASAQTVTVSDEADRDVIVVTGQKVERSLQDTPQSVAVITDVQLEEENIIDLIDAVEATANVSTRDGSSFVIRGINSLNVSGAGQGDLATIYVDGTALPRQASFAAPVDIWDISQVEIFRGPQSTLQGRASLAGAIIVNTADPTYEWTGRARAIYTTEAEETRLGFALGGPIINDQAAFRIAVEDSQSDGFSTNLTRNAPLNPIDTFIARGKLLIEPAAIPGLDVMLSYSHDERSSGDQFVSLSAADPEDARVGFGNDPTVYETEIDIATATVNYQINDTWSLTSVTGWNGVDYDFVLDNDRSAETIEVSTLDSRIETWTQEVRAQYAGETIDGVFGVYYSDQDTPRNLNSATLSVDLVNQLGLGLLLQGPPFSLDPATSAFVVSQYPTPAIIQTDGSLTQNIETYAVFSDMSWDFAEDWTLYAGFRWDVEQQSNTNETVVDIVTPLPDPALYPAPLNLVIGGVNGFLQEEAENATSPFAAFESPEFGGFLPKLGVGYAIDDLRSISFSVQRGYRSGGTAINNARATAFQFDQEFIWNYEFSLRSLWLDGDLALNSNVFFIDWTDQQVRVQLSNNVFDVETRNAGASTVYGFELESRYAATPDLDLYGSIGYAKTEFDEFDVVVSGVVTDFSGNAFAFAPQWTLNAGFTWTPDENWIVNANANYASASYIRADRPQTSRDSEARTLVNFRGGWRNEHLGIFLAGNNLLDDEYVVTQFPNDPTTGIPPAFAQFGDPRTFSLQLEAQF